MTTSFSIHSPKATNVILHAFDWPYSRITENAEAIANAGFKAVLVSPPLKSLKSKNGTPWWQRYQPQDYRVIDNQLGNTTEFKKMTAALNEHEILIYADIVFNHMANESDQRDDLDYPNSQIIQDYKNKNDYSASIRLFGDLSQPLFTEQDFVQAFPIQNWKDPWQVQHGRISGSNEDPGLPTLKCNENVVKAQKSYLKALRHLGISGFRIDAAKHMTLEHIQQVWDAEIAQGTHIFGEIITDGGASKEEYELFLKPYLKSTTLGAYDFPLFHSLFKVFEKDESVSGLINPYSVGQALAVDRAITFATTHDIPNNDVFLDQVMSEHNERLAYCYLFGRDGGVPLVYSDLDTSGIAREDGSPRWYDSWKDPILIKMIQFHNYAHGQTMQYLEHSANHLMFSRGDKGLVVINKGLSEKTVQLPNEHFADLLEMEGVRVTKQVKTTDNGSKKEMLTKVTLPAKSCAMFVTTL
ncbi:alpha-amylase family glycosyl hydrolase [uncultured Photobacterium sp.]|uniref:alpha-amylase family glycosyl hydrolase n=1 Tax=uncultured Photobacterium sp. TaxID=173973 RepID=UPI002606047B|nr:alpha-amylase family glycosyl hydrolase [uncultured Photobacterium sp.]